MYAKIIEKILEKHGYGGKYDPRHIEAYMRLVYGTLDGISRKSFETEVSACRLCIEIEGVEKAEALTLTFGL